MAKYFILVFTFFSLQYFAQVRNYKTINDTVFNVGDIIRLPQSEYSLCHPTLRPSVIDSLRPIAVFIKAHLNIKFEISSYTDSRGSIADNIKFSQGLADNIRGYFIQDFQLSKEQLSAKGYGESQPIYTDDAIAKVKTREEKELMHQENRRIELKIIAIK